MVPEQEPEGSRAGKRGGEGRRKEEEEGSGAGKNAHSL